MKENLFPEPLVLARPEHCVSRKNIDPDALKVMTRLCRNGHKAYLVGGSVRDLLLEKKPKDFDVSTDARPGQIKKLFRNSRVIGRRFRLVHIFFRDNKIIEVATFRKKPQDPPGEGEEKSAEVKKGDNTFGEPHEDAMRRDLTINGLFYDILTFSVIDYVGGIKDLRAGIARTIGDPAERFREDPMRMVRTVRHAELAGFSIEPKTYKAIVKCAPLLKDINLSRVQDDVQKDLDRGVYASVLRVQMETGILKGYYPELDSYLRSKPNPRSLFEPGWIWRSLSQLDTGGKDDSRTQKFRLATLLFPLLEKRLLDAFPNDPEPFRHAKETHLFLIAISVPIGVRRLEREAVKFLWGSWLRLLNGIDAGRIPERFQKKPYFQEVCEWYGFHRSMRTQTGAKQDDSLQRAKKAGKAAVKRKRKRRKKKAPPA